MAIWNWALADRDYDGFYDIRLRYGYVLGIDRIHIPVAEDVKITKGRLPVLITDDGQSGADSTLKDLTNR